MLTIVFYNNNGYAAKQRAREIAAKNKGDFARCYDVGAWDNTSDKCDVAEMMPDILSWQRDRIINVFGEKAVDFEFSEEFQEEEQQPARKELGLMPAKEVDPAAEPSGLKAVHKGGGRWFVMNGDERISGPHDKAEAIRLAEAVIQES